MTMATIELHILAITTNKSQYLMSSYAKQNREKNTETQSLEIPLDMRWIKQMPQECHVQNATQSHAIVTHCCMHRINVVCRWAHGNRKKVSLWAEMLANHLLSICSRSSVKFHRRETHMNKWRNIVARILDYTWLKPVGNISSAVEGRNYILCLTISLSKLIVISFTTRNV